MCLLILPAWVMSIVASWKYGVFRQSCFYERFGLYDGRMVLTDEAVGVQGQRRWIQPRFSDAPDYFIHLRSPQISPYYYIVIPLWIPFVVVCAPTLLLWWRDRSRIPPGCCHNCGYDLTGNVSGVCPECGGAITSGSPA